MSENAVPTLDRVHIGFFGLRNAGKSSVVNAVTGQQLSVVSDVKGTTTDPVRKAMELLPIGPVFIIDTPGFDDEGTLGELRVQKTKEVLRSVDIAVLVTDASATMNESEQELLSLFRDRRVPFVIAYNKIDLLDNPLTVTADGVAVSALTGEGIGELKERIAATLTEHAPPVKRLVGDLLSENDTVVLVTPIDESAPKGRLILPQQQTIRDVLDAGAMAFVTKDTELPAALAALSTPPALVITDSQAFAEVSKIVPDNVPLTSFSILFARLKSDLDTVVHGAMAIDRLQDGDKVLISEGCTHHRQCGDIGTVKLPALLRRYTGKQLHVSFTSGGTFPDDLSEYALVIHCGGCMLNDREMTSRRLSAQEQQIPMTNYGIAIAHMNGILKRAVRPFGL